MVETSQGKDQRKFKAAYPLNERAWFLYRWVRFLIRDLVGIFETLADS